MRACTLDVTVERDGKWWVFDIPELCSGGQTKNLAEANVEAQGVAAMWLDVEPATILVNVSVKAPEPVLGERRAE